MARMCPVINRKVIYLQCLDCEETCRYAGAAVPVPVHAFESKSYHTGSTSRTVHIGGKKYSVRHAANGMERDKRKRHTANTYKQARVQ